MHARDANREQDKAGKTIPVWDPLIRFGHWGLAAAFAVAWLTGEDWENVHVVAGYCVATIVVVRTIWGFVGPRTARFTSFVRGPRAALDYLRGLVRGTAPRHLGHNPAGAAMVLALLLSLAGTAGTGMALLAVEEGEGPLAGIIQPATGHDGREEFLEEAHEILANGTLVLVVMHVLGVLASGIAHRENLVRAMITGRKRAH
ncbi:MAG: cytochrome b/b6 domain-containing protein [Pseudomonadales bacterium]|jgi:cytochrome b|nr:cytochrome b/b6 domain-containing protein [Pseudomonadales bacterium]